MGIQMMRAYIKESPYGLLLLTAVGLSLALVFLSIGYLDFEDKTMFSIPLAVMVWIIPSLLILFWLIYLPTKRFLYSKTITWTHVLITVSTTILTVVILYIVFISGTPSYSVEFIGSTIRIVFITFVCGQCIYLANLLLGLFAKKI